MRPYKGPRNYPHHPAKFSSHRTTINGQPTIEERFPKMVGPTIVKTACPDSRLSVECCPLRTELGRMMPVEDGHRTPYFTSRRVCRAIISSSLVGIHQAETREAGALIRGPP